jgi:hypothetical protein
MSVDFLPGRTSSSVCEFFPEEYPLNVDFLPGRTSSGKSRSNNRRVRKADVIEVVAKYEARLKEDLGWLNPMGYLKANHLGTPQYC